MKTTLSEQIRRQVATMSELESHVAAQKHLLSMEATT